MLRRTILSTLMLASFLTPLYAAVFPTDLAGLGASPARAEGGSTRTFTPTPLAGDRALAADQPSVALRELRLPALIEPDIPFLVEANWASDTIDLSGRWEVVYQLHSADGSLAAELISERELSATLALSTTLEGEQFWVSPELAPGAYQLSLLVRDPSGERAPLGLAIEGQQADGSYPLGTVEIGALAAAVEPLATTRLYLPMMRKGPSGNTGGGDPVVGSARGYLTTPQELQAIKQKADQRIEPYATNVRELLEHSSLESPTAWVEQANLSGNVVCSDGTQKDSAGRTIPKGPVYLLEGSRLAYAKMLAANLLGSGSRATALARHVRSRILDLTDTTNWGGDLYSAENQCILYMSWYVPIFIMSADLLESFPEIWSASDKRNFQRWLANEVYPKAAWASRARTNNWGSGGSYGAAVIADYLWDSGLTLKEVEPARRTLSPGTAYREHTQEQLSRMSTSVTERDQSDSRCLPYKGIQPGGGIPDELRRARISDPESLCDAKYLPSNSGSYSPSYNYTMTQAEHLVAHAELALRRGDKRLYDNIASDRSGSLLRAIKFVIKNPAKPSASYDWDVNRKAMLYIAYRYYRDSAIKARLHSAALRSGETITYGRLTHEYASSETPGLPPTVAPATP